MLKNHQGKICVLISVLSASNALAGLHGLTWHSRANCYNNESITWDFTTNHIMSTVSLHLENQELRHQLNTDWVNTWRSAAVHWVEAVPTQKNWAVEGTHSIYENNMQITLGNTTARDCSIYDGWWDQNKDTSNEIK
jgi:hypothetical protein